MRRLTILGLSLVLSITAVVLSSGQVFAEDPCFEDPWLPGCPDFCAIEPWHELCGGPGDPCMMDSDFDGVPDCVDLCPGEPGFPPDGCLDPCMFDDDGDGIGNCYDLCPADPGKVEPGVCGCDVPDIDSDADGTMDCLDLCPADPGKVDPGICGCGTTDVDSDGDGVADCQDVCAGGDDSQDADGDGIPDACDTPPTSIGIPALPQVLLSVFAAVVIAGMALRVRRAYKPS